MRRPLVQGSALISIEPALGSADLARACLPQRDIDYSHGDAETLLGQRGCCAVQFFPELLDSEALCILPPPRVRRIPRRSVEVRNEVDPGAASRTFEVAVGELCPDCRLDILVPVPLYFDRDNQFRTVGELRHDFDVRKLTGLIPESRLKERLLSHHQIS